MSETKAEQARSVEAGGVLIGVLLGFDDEGRAEVSFPGIGARSIPARATVELNPAHIGSQVALMFESGDMERPLIIGRILLPGVPAQPPTPAETVSVRRDDETLTLDAEREIVLRCGNASITLTRAGKIILKGKYVLSRSSGVNKIKGASVQIN